jgi:hypothetical protein
LLPPEQTAKIRAIGVPLVLPTAIPEGFVVAQVNATQSDRGSQYQILYRDGSDRCFVIEHTSGGVGSPPATEARLPINPPLVTDGATYGLHYGRDLDPSTPASGSALMSDWLPVNGHFYRLAGASYINRNFDFPRPCTDLAPAEAVQIIESLALVSDDITGDK